MKNAGLLLCVLLFASAVHLSAQVTVEVMTAQDQFLPGEAMPIAVRITNRSGQTLKFGEKEGWLKFAVEARDGYLAYKNGDAPVKGEFTLQSSERATVHVNIGPYFQLPKAGHYTVTATVSIPEWGQDISSAPKGFDVIKGAQLWSQSFGVPRAPGDTNAPEMRQYALQEANYLRNQLTLYAQVTDDSGRINKVIPIGPMISFGQPQPEVDKMSDLHVLYQNGPRSFKYTVIDPDGDVLVRQTYDYTTRPRLMADKDGILGVVGGTRRLSRDDIPPSTPSAGNDISSQANP